MAAKKVEVSLTQEQASLVDEVLARVQFGDPDQQEQAALIRKELKKSVG